MIKFCFSGESSILGFGFFASFPTLSIGDVPGAQGGCKQVHQRRKKQSETTKTGITLYQVTL